MSRLRPVRPARARAVAHRVALAAAALLACAGGARAGDALAPCRDFARTPAAARLLALARGAMESYWSGAPVDTAGVPDWPGEPGALYVSLARGRATRACVGSVVPPRGALAECVRALALDALRADPRRPPVRREEMATL
ncbi:MAG: AMMECR1 domain-containing protein, partial [Candidatus Eisenbacteria bacterium]|nr:AMMECR1 domain-containing protein [Candidatus Eisenbacteria bacterium]